MTKSDPSEIERLRAKRDHLQQEADAEMAALQAKQKQWKDEVDAANERQEERRTEYNKLTGVIEYLESFDGA